MIEIVFHNPRVGIAELEGGEKAIVLADAESGINATVALNEEAAKAMGEALASAGITIARKLPADGDGGAG